MYVCRGKARVDRQLALVGKLELASTDLAPPIFATHKAKNTMLTAMAIRGTLEAAGVREDLAINTLHRGISFLILWRWNGPGIGHIFNNSSIDTEEIRMAAVTMPSQQRVGPVTDLTCWRLANERGRQTWEYDEQGHSGREPNFVERHALGLDIVSELRIVVEAGWPHLISIPDQAFVNCSSKSSLSLLVLIWAGSKRRIYVSENRKDFSRIVSVG